MKTDEQISKSFINNSYVEPQPKELVEHKAQLWSHLDGVREVTFSGENILVSVSEDCLVKIWDTRKFAADENVDPYYTMRDHSGPLFTACTY